MYGIIVNGGDDGDVSRLPSPPFGICEKYIPHLRGEKKYDTILTLFRKEEDSDMVSGPMGLTRATLKFT